MPTVPVAEQPGVLRLRQLDLAVPAIITALIATRRVARFPHLQGAGIKERLTGKPIRRMANHRLALRRLRTPLWLLASHTTDALKLGTKFEAREYRAPFLAADGLVTARHESLTEHPAIRSYQNDGAFPYETSLFAYRKV